MRGSAGRLIADDAWSTRVLGSIAGILLTVGAAGGLQRLCQETGMAELLGEHVSNWHLSGAGALLVVFLVAATVKTLQGSSLVAAITAAGIVQPLLIPLRARRRERPRARRTGDRRRRHDGVAHQR